ncbi:hypothetical protein Tco_1405671 [Tanacetum coccineum]
MEREIKQLKQSQIPLVKVRWNSRRGPEFTWEREDSFKQKYPQLFTNRASSSTKRSIRHGVLRYIGGHSLERTSDNLLPLTLVTEIDEIKVFNVTEVDILKEVKARLARHKNLFTTVMSAIGEEQVLRRSSSIFTSVYVAVQKLKKTLARASVQLGWQFQAKRC